MSRFHLCWLVLVLGLVGCKSPADSFSGEHTFAELRTIKGAVLVQPEGAEARAPFRRERLIDKERIKIPEGGLAWMRRDGGATWLISGPSELVVGPEKVHLSGGRVFVDTELGEPVTVTTPHGGLELSGARVSLEVDAKKATAYVLRGSARGLGKERASAGEMLTFRDKKVQKEAVVSWQDWTGGLGTADPTAAQAPFGIGTVGARPAGDKGKPRSSLVIERLQVNVTIEKDLALTEVDQTFVNPTSETVEGVFRFRTPEDAVLGQFGVDRDGRLVWGRVKESKSAEQVYESHVYQGSTEEPALLSWEAPSVYSARLYPIHGGAKRRVVTRYSQWLSRQGKDGERRLYVYPMAAEGAKSSLPRIEEMTIDIDVTGAQATHIRSGMAGVREGDHILVKAFDFTPRADLSIELFDSGSKQVVGYRSPHKLEEGDIPEGMDEDYADEVSRAEADYVAIPLRAPVASGAPGGMDLAVVVDTSAATEPAALAIGRALASSLLSHLGPEDRVALFAGDSALRPVAPGSDKLTKVEPNLRKKWLSGLAATERGGATDLGALLASAASVLDAKRPSAVIYIGDGSPSVGEIAPADLRKRLSRLPSHTRIFPVAIGSRPNVALLDQVARGAQVEVVEDAYGAARVSLRVLENVGRVTWLGAKVDLGTGVERILPEVIPPLGADETVMIVGRRTGELPSKILLSAGDQKASQEVVFEHLPDRGDLRRRWGTYRLKDLIEEGAGRSTLVDLSERFALVSPFTSLYVPTRAEEEAEDYVDEQASYEDEASRFFRWKPWARDSSLGKHAESAAMAPPPGELLAEQADNKEGGTGTRAKGEEGSMGSASASPGARYAVAPQSAMKKSAAPMDGAQGMGDLNLDAAAAPPSQAPVPAAAPEAEATPAAPSSPVKLARAPAFSASEHSSSGRVPTAKEYLSGNYPDQDDPMIGGLGVVGTGRGGGGYGAGPGLGRLQGLGSDEALGGAREDKAEPKREELLYSTKDRFPGRTRGMIGMIGHAPVPCGGAAELPLSERQTLWSERLAGAGAIGSLEVYRSALRACEATSWRERVALLVLMVDHLPTVVARVELWRHLLMVSPGAADAVYRFLVARVRTAQELKELHEALGLEQIDPDVLNKLLNTAKDPRQRLTLLRASAEKFPGDSELSLRVLAAYEDAQDEAGGRAFARKLRMRVDATSHLRTSVGEYYLRLAKRASDPKGAQAERDEAEGRRTFGEIVEFAPEDPLARRHLGDLLSAHGWFDQALRQYETLERLTPDDPTVYLLLARAAQGMGKTERAVKLAEKAASTGAPDSQEPVSVAARALSSAFLAEARVSAGKAGNKDELQRLRGRAGRLAAEKAGAGARVILVWSHPELRPSLWTNALGTLMPSAENLPLLGIAQAQLGTSPPPEIEVHLDPEDAEHAARLGLTAKLFVVLEEGDDSEIILIRDVGFGDQAQKSKEKRRFSLSGKTLQEIE